GADPPEPRERLPPPAPYLLGCPRPLGQRALAERPRALPPPRPLRSGRHRRPRRRLLRVLLQARVSLRLPHRRSRRPERGRGRPRHHQRRLLPRALRTLPDPAHLPPDAPARRSKRLRGQGRGPRRLPRREDRPPPVVAAWLWPAPG